MSNKRALWGLIPAAILCSVLLVGLEQSGRQSSAPAPDTTVNPLGATVASLAASDSSVEAQAVMPMSPAPANESGNGGDGGTPVVATSASTTVTEVAQRQSAERGLETGTRSGDAGSSPALSATPIIRSSSQAPLMEAIQSAFPVSEWDTAYSVAMCESGGDPTEVGAAGEEGAFQVRPEYHGPVPSDLYGQALQAAAIVSVQGWSPWSCA